MNEKNLKLSRTAKENEFAEEATPQIHYSQTEQELTSADREKQRLLYETILRYIPVGVRIWQLEDPEDLKSFRLIMSNAAATLATGVDPDSIMGKLMIDTFPHAFETDLPKLYAEVIKTGQTRDLGRITYGDERISQRVFALKLLPLNNNCVCTSFENVTAQVKMEEDLRKTQENLEIRIQERTHELQVVNQLLENDIAERKRLERESDQFFTLSLDLLGTADTNGYFKRLNPAFSETLGYPLETLLKYPFIDFVHPDDVEATLAEVAKLASGIPTIRFENRYRCADGSYKWLLWATTPSVEDNLLYATARDITLHKLLEEELKHKNEFLEEQNKRIEEANRLKSEFLANMSHELRTPLNGIIGFAEILYDDQEEPLSSTHKEFLDDILFSARHLLQLINDILDLAKIESGKMEFFLEEVDLNRVVREVVGSLGAMSEAKKIEVEIAISPSLTKTMLDTAKFKQLLYNYLSNALKFTPEKGLVSIRIQPVNEKGLRLEVQDTGIGISSTDIERLFVEFQQLDASTSKKYAGTGLGLALTKRIVEAQGGSVGVQSTLKKGSIFFAILPGLEETAITGSRQPDVELNILPEIIQDTLEIPQINTILIIEGNEPERNWLVTTLESAGYRVITANTGRQALEICQEQNFAALILDLQLPDMAGWDVLHSIRLHSRNQTVPAIIVTVNEEKNSGMGFSVHDFLVKPSTGPDLLLSLEQAGVRPDNNSTIVVVEDDLAMLKLVETKLNKLGYRVISCQTGIDGLMAISREKPRAIILDLLLTGMDGFEFLQHLRESQSHLHIPIIVWTNKDLTKEENKNLKRLAEATVLKSEGGTAHLLQELFSYAPPPNRPKPEVS